MRFATRIAQAIGACRKQDSFNRALRLRHARVRYHPCKGGGVLVANLALRSNPVHARKLGGETAQEQREFREQTNTG